MQWLIDNKLMVISVLLGLSETLALIPGIKANSVFQLTVNGLKSLAGLFLPKPPQA